MTLLDDVLGGFRWYRKMRGGRWTEANCVDGRWFRLPDEPSNQCFCPGCRVDLVTAPRVEWWEEVGVTHYRCSCGMRSRWLLDAPVPILLPSGPK